MDVTIGDENTADNANTTVRKERPIWMMESTVVSTDKSQVILIRVFINLYAFLISLYPP